MEYKGSSVQQTLKRVSQSVAYGSIFRPSTHKPRNGYPTQKPFKILRAHHTGKLSARRALVRPVLRLRYGG